MGDIEVVYTDGITIADDEFRRLITTEKERFRCNSCGKLRSYLENYAGTYEKDGVRKHFCISCLVTVGGIIDV